MSHKPRSIKRSLHKIQLIPPNEGGRISRHNKRIVLLSDFLKNPAEFDSENEGIRTKSELNVADGPTVKKGKLNIPRGASMSHRDYEESQTPTWWKDNV